MRKIAACLMFTAGIFISAPLTYSSATSTNQEKIHQWTSSRPLAKPIHSVIPIPTDQQVQTNLKHQKFQIVVAARIAAYTAAVTAAQQAAAAAAQAAAAARTTTPPPSAPRTSTSSSGIPAAWMATAICEEGGRNDPYAGYFGILEWHGFDGYPTAGSAPLSVQLAWEASIGQGPPDAPGQCHSY